jgi:phenylacetate-coenzyme A ligase PaaK-like adenylate-forming protein
VFVQSENEFAHWVAAGWRALLRMGVEPELRIVGIPAPTPLHITKKLFAAFGGDVGLTVTTPLPELVEALGHLQPEVILTSASVGGLLAEAQLQGTLGVAPRHVIVSGEVLTEDTRRRIGNA